MMDSELIKVRLRLRGRIKKKELSVPTHCSLYSTAATKANRMSGSVQMGLPGKRTHEAILLAKFTGTQNIKFSPPPKVET